jgi:hypothetical protein
MAITRLGGANAITGTIPTSVAPGQGKILQVVNATHSTEVTSNSVTAVDTGLTASITPSSSSNKILIDARISGCGKETNNTYLRIFLQKDNSNLIKMDEGAGYTADSGANRVGTVATTYLDSPSTTSAITYKCVFRSQSNAATVVVNDESSVSTITLMEIEA